MVGTVLKGKMDPTDNGAIYTDAFVARQTARILGVFSAITRPTPLSALMQRYPIHGRLFRTELDRLIDESKLPGKLQGRGDKMEYVPTLQQKTQDRWIQGFYRSNQYVEFDTVERLGIKKPKPFLKSMFSDGVALETCTWPHPVPHSLCGFTREREHNLCFFLQCPLVALARVNVP
jgi:hypothetical protein